MRSDGDQDAIQAIALTAFARGEARDRVLAAGCDAYLAKPIDAADLVATVARLAGRPSPS